MRDGSQQTQQNAQEGAFWNYALPSPGELQVLRLRAELDQKEAAEHINVSRKTIVAYENGRFSPSIETTRQLLGLYRAEIVSGDSG